MVRKSYSCEICKAIYSDRRSAKECESKRKSPELKPGTTLEHICSRHGTILIPELNNPHTVIESFEGIEARTHQNRYKSITHYKNGEGESWFYLSHIIIKELTDGMAHFELREYNPIWRSDIDQRDVALQSRFENNVEARVSV